MISRAKADKMRCDSAGKNRMISVHALERQRREIFIDVASHILKARIELFAHGHRWQAAARRQLLPCHGRPERATPWRNGLLRHKDICAACARRQSADEAAFSRQFVRQRKAEHYTIRRHAVRR